MHKLGLLMSTANILIFTLINCNVVVPKKKKRIRKAPVLLCFFVQTFRIFPFKSSQTTREYIRVTFQLSQNYFDAP